ncbi:MAG: hypothetical protein WAK48_20025 [Candidatus Acidiferrum sp.]|jgi:hypothetical protein
MTLKSDEPMRVLRVRQLFDVRCSEEHTETGVLLFYAWLEKHYPDLLPTGPGDPYQHLKMDLSGLFE